MIATAATPARYTGPSGATAASPTRQTTATTCIRREIASEAGTPKRTGIDRRPCARSKSRSWQAYRTSNPPTHVPMAAASSHGSHPPRPPTASQPPTGATAIARPRNSCVQVVQRLAREYQNTLASATGDSARQTLFSRHDANTNAADDTATKNAASRGLIAPRGISRFAVRGFRASIRASTRRLNPIAALRAATIATTTQKRGRTPFPRFAMEKAYGPFSFRASSAPARANGSAKTEWLTRTNEAYVRRRAAIITTILSTGSDSDRCRRPDILRRPRARAAR